MASAESPSVPTASRLNDSDRSLHLGDQMAAARKHLSNAPMCGGGVITRGDRHLCATGPRDRSRPVLGYADLLAWADGTVAKFGSWGDNRHAGRKRAIILAVLACGYGVQLRRPIALLSRVSAPLRKEGCA